MNGGASSYSLLFTHSQTHSSHSLTNTHSSALSIQEKRLTSGESVNQSVDQYNQLHATTTSTDVRNEQYSSLVNSYYDLATVFYEWGWGSSFHFSYQYPGESFQHSIQRHEYQLAAHLGSRCLSDPHSKILDVGCGVGGPMRNLCQFLAGKITGITLNHYQVNRGNELNRQAGLAHRAESVQGDFMQLPFDKESFDGAYAIEATCHAPDRVACYKQIYEKLKPGAVFACYEWCLTDSFDPNNAEHVRMKRDIELGNGLPDVTTTTVCWKAMQAAGFEPLMEKDLALTPNVQVWYTPLMPSWNPLSQRFQFNWFGAIITNIMIYSLELFWLAPKGTIKTQKVLQAGGFALRDAGKEGLFTAMYLMVGRKPSK